MSLCAHPTCSRNDDVSDDEMYREYIPVDDCWVPVCARHVDRDKKHVEMTPETKQLTGDELHGRA